MIQLLAFVSRFLYQMQKAGVRADYAGANLADLSPEGMEEVLSDTVLKEFKVRLARIGLDYQTPVAS